ncbi:MAG: DUF2000 family protein [Gammaproteobacteria bacterium]
MEFSTKFAIVVADDLAQWQKLNVISFLTSGIIGDAPEIIGEVYRDATNREYAALCIQPTVILKSSRDRLQTFLDRAHTRNIKPALYIEDMFETGHDEANRLSVMNYETSDLPLVGLAIRADKKAVDKVFKGAKLHD